MLSMMRGGAALLAAELRRLSMQRGGAAPPAAELRWLSMQRGAAALLATEPRWSSTMRVGRRRRERIYLCARSRAEMVIDDE